MSLFDIDNVKKELNVLEKETQKEEFWNKSPNETSKILSKMKHLKQKTTKYEDSKNEVENLIELTELANMEEDVNVAEDITTSTKKLEKEI